MVRRMLTQNCAVNREMTNANKQKINDMCVNQHDLHIPQTKVFHECVDRAALTELPQRDKRLTGSG